MKSVQDRVLSQIEQHLTNRGYSVAIAHQYANMGKIHVFPTDTARSSEATIQFDFQSDTYTLRLMVNGRKIPSQPDRLDYFDFYQAYSEPTRFWNALDQSLPVLKKSKAQTAERIRP